MESKLVTVIMPVYNVEKYLDAAVNSVRNQSYTNLQIILVDDGSLDASSSMCDKYASEDSRIEVIHKENGGQAVARNLAVKSARGEYILFVDSDDILTSDHIKIMTDCALSTEADIVTCSYKKFFDGEAVPTIGEGSFKHKEYTAESAMETLFYQRVFTHGPVCKLIKSHIVTNNPFPEGIIYEDLATVYRWFHSSNKIVFVDGVTYFYRQRKHSTMRSSFSTRKFDRIDVTKALKEFVEEHHPDIIPAANARWLLSNLQVLMELPLSKEYKAKKIELYDNIKSVRKGVIADKKVKRSLRIMAISTYLGATVTILEGRLYNKLVNKE